MIRILAAAGLGALYVAFDRYRRTSHGKNPWTLDGFMAVATLHQRFEQAARMIDGTITSVFRSERVNKAAGGVETSRHLDGLAVDIKPRLHSPKEAAEKLYAAAVRGELGPVRTVLEEPTVVHVDFFAPGEPRRAPKLGYWERKAS